MLLLVLAVLGFCAAEVASVVMFALYVPAKVAAAWALSTTVLGTCVLVYVWRRYYRHMTIFRGGELHVKTGPNELLLLLAGVMLTVPGMFSDFVGLLLLAPSVRQLIVATMEKQWLAGRHEPSDRDDLEE